MESEKRQDDEHAANIRGDTIFFLLRSLGFVPFILGLAICVYVIRTHWQDAIDEASLPFAEFEEITGVALADVEFRDLKVYYRVWWQEYVLPTAHYEELLSLAKETQFNSETESREAFSAKAKELGHESIKSNDFYNARSTGSGLSDSVWYHVRTIPADEYPEATEPLTGLVGYTPLALRAQIPATGRLDHEHAVAEFRVFNSWNDGPVPISLLAEAAEAAFPISRIGVTYGNGDPVFPNHTDSDRKAFAATLGRAANENDISEALIKYEVATNRDAQFEYFKINHLFVDLVAAGKIPVPALLDPEEHDRLRREDAPGELKFAQMYRSFDTYVDPAVAKYAEAKGLDPVETALAASDAASGSFAFEQLFQTPNLVLAVLCFFFIGYTMIKIAQGDGIWWRPSDSTSHASTDDTPTAEDLGVGDIQTKVHSKSGQNLPTVVPEVVSQNPSSLMATAVDQVHGELSAKGPVGRNLARKKNISVSRQTKEVVDADTNLIEAQAGQIKSVLRNQNEIDDLQEDAELRALRRQKKEAALKSEIAQAEDSEHEHRHRSKKRDEPPPAPIPAPKKPPPLTMEERIAKNAQAAIGKGMAVENVKARLEAQAEKDFANDPEKLELALDRIEDWYETEIQKG